MMAILSYSAPVARRFDRTAISALILGITSPLSLFIFLWDSGVMTAIFMISQPAFAVICAMASLVKIFRSSGALKGVGFAMGGLFLALAWTWFLIYGFFIQTL
jgi:hypothetical protein